VAGGRVFVTDSTRTKGNRAIERAIALDEITGQILWTKEWEADYTGLQLVYAIGPRATPTVDGDQVYMLGAMGHLLALDVKTGAVLWQRDYVKDFDASAPSWGFAGAPLVDGDRLICLVGGEPDAKVMALDKRTGAEIWRALSSDWEPGYGQPIIIEAGGARQLIIFHPKAISALDPATGKVYWEVPHTVELGLTIPTPVRSGPYLFFTSQYGGARMLKLDDVKPGATVLWSGPGESDPEYPSLDTLNSVISTPVLEGDYIYGLDGHGMLRCLHLTTGKQVWEVKDLLKETAPHATAFFVRHGDRYFINNDRGELVIAKLSPKGFEEISRAKLIEPTHPYTRRRAIPYVHWTHAAYANKHIIVRNDKEIVRFSLAKES
jgi:outer membrane protein assembly factor BamB